MADELSPAEMAEEWHSAATGLLRIEMMRRGLGYADLVKALAVVGVQDNERNVRNKVARGTFSATFFVQALVAMGVTSLDLDPARFPHWRAKVTRVWPPRTRETPEG